jgi:hypothetical protein
MGVVKQLSLELFGKVAKNPPAHQTILYGRLELPISLEAPFKFKPQTYVYCKPLIL